MIDNRPARTLRMAAIVFAAVTLLNGETVAGTLRVGGTGIGLAAMQAMGDSLASVDADFRVEVLPSMGTPGGLAALKAAAIDVAIAARLLTPAERALGLTEAGCVTTGLVFASSLKDPPGIATADLPRLYAEARPTWPDGSPVKVILRSRVGSEVPYLAAAVPGLAAAFETAYKQPGTPVGATDQENAELAQKIAGSFAIATLLQINAEHLNLRVLALDGVKPTPATIADKSYPFTIPFCLVLPASPVPEAIKFTAYFKSQAEQALMRSFGAIPVD